MPAKAEVPAVYGAIQKVLERFSSSGLAKGRTNTQQGYQFRGIDDVYNMLSTYLVEAGLLILPRVVSTETLQYESKNGGILFNVKLMVEYDLIAVADGSVVTCRVAGEAMDSADKASNKAMSAAYKYLCLQAFCIPTEGDNDADATTHELAPAKQQVATPRRDNGPKLTIDQHTKAMQDAKTEPELKRAFALAWKQYEDPRDPKAHTPTQLKFKTTYDNALVALIDSTQPEDDPVTDAELDAAERVRGVAQ